MKNMPKLSYKRGFTLIELLVVIAVIGIMSAVVLASLNSSRTKAMDSAVKADLTNVRKQAELFYTNNNESYGTFVQATCPTVAAAGNLFSGDSNILRMIAHAVAQGGNGSSCSSVPGAYAVSVGLKTAGQTWCVDSAGRAQQFAGTPAASITANRCN